MSESHTHSCCQEDSNQKPKPWFKKPLFFWSLLTAMLYAISFAVPHLEHFRHSLLDYLRMLIGPMAIGLLVGGLIDYYIPQDYISKYLTAHKKRTVIYATGLGFLMSACSHGILALSMELHKKGASGPAVISFLLASPWANLPITFLLVGFFGWKGFLIILISLAVAMTTGLLFQVLDEKGWIEKNPHTVNVPKAFSIRADIARRMRNYQLSPAQVTADIKGIVLGMVELADMVVVWILIGTLVASASAAFVPVSFFQNYLGASLTGLLVTMAAAAVLEVCSEGTAPLAFEIYRQTGALGNAFAFLMGGVVTDYTEIGLVWTRLGKRTALWMLAITLPQVFVYGALLNILFR